MNVKTPTLYRHSDGRWMTRWAKKNHYFGRDYAGAVQRFADSLKEWADWRERRTRAMEATLRPRKRLSLIELAEQFIESKTLQGGRELGGYYRRHLKRFLTHYSVEFADQLGIPQLQALKDEMLRGDFAHKTINHDIVAAKAMLTWGIDQTLIPFRPLRGVKTLPLGPPPFKALDVKVVRRMVKNAPDPVRRWLGTQYLTAARPIEIVRAVHGQGDWVEDGIFRLHHGKTDRSSGMARHLVFSKLALRWFAKCEPVWSRLDSYSFAVRKVCGPGGPHPLRHSAATHLIQAGATRADTELILGHMPPRVALIYAPISWQPLRQTAALLKL